MSFQPCDGISLGVSASLPRPRSWADSLGACRFCPRPWSADSLGARLGPSAGLDEPLRPTTSLRNVQPRIIVPIVERVDGPRRSPGRLSAGAGLSAMAGGTSELQRPAQRRAMVLTAHESERFRADPRPASPFVWIPTRRSEPGPRSALLLGRSALPTGLWVEDTATEAMIVGSGEPVQ